VFLPLTGWGRNATPRERAIVKLIERFLRAGYQAKKRQNRHAA
jgi:hypothetical protein